MTVFEEGYKAHLQGQPKEGNPYNKLDQPYSFRKWVEGWQAAQRKRIEKAL